MNRTRILSQRKYIHKHSLAASHPWETLVLAGTSRQDTEAKLIAGTPISGYIPLQSPFLLSLGWRVLEYREQGKM